MCDFTPVGTWLTLLGIWVGLAASSALLSVMWRYYGTALPWLVRVFAAAALSWALGAMTANGFAMNAVATFCACASSVPACRDACVLLSPALVAMTVMLTILITLCAIQMSDVIVSETPAFNIGFALAAVPTLGLVIWIAIYGNLLMNCGAP